MRVLTKKTVRRNRRNKYTKNLTISKYDLIDKISSYRVKNKFNEVNELETILYDVIQKDKLEDSHTYEIKLNYRIAKKHFKNLIQP